MYSTFFTIFGPASLLTFSSIKLTFQVSDLDATAFDPEYPAAEEDSEGPASGPASITCSLVITKSAAPGALMVDLETCDEGFEITNVAVYDKALADAKGAEGDWERRSRYMGPRKSRFLLVHHERLIYRRPRIRPPRRDCSRGIRLLSR